VTFQKCIDLGLVKCNDVSSGVFVRSERESFTAARAEGAACPFRNRFGKGRSHTTVTEVAASAAQRNRT
jgi:hypothetical protein